MATYKDWIVEHPTKGKIKLGKLSHNELCRFTFDLYIMNQEMNEKLKEFVELFNKCLVESQGTWIMNEKLKGFVELFNNLEKKAKKNGTKD